MIFRSEKQNVSPCIKQVYIEMSTQCNLSCCSCVRNAIADFSKMHFSPAMMQRLLPMLKELELDRIVLFGFGEALCNPNIEYLLKLLRSLNTKIILVTNAAFLTENLSAYLVGLPLEELYVSWDDDIEGSINVIRQGMQAGLFRKNIETLMKIKGASHSNLPLVGMEIVALKSNYQFIPQIISYGHSIGIEIFIVSNIFPYTDDMKNEILYEIGTKPKINLKKYLRHEIKRYNVLIANQSAHKMRRCPFVERGTVFISVQGDVSPCPELAYSHPAYYFGSDRMHKKFIIGNINKQSLQNIWEEKIFSELRKSFHSYDYVDCSYCACPDRCYQRTVEAVDCYWNPTPCGECLWAKDIVLCP